MEDLLDKFEKLYAENDWWTPKHSRAKLQAKYPDVDKLQRFYNSRVTAIKRRKERNIREASMLQHAAEGGTFGKLPTEVNFDFADSVAPDDSISMIGSSYSVAVTPSQAEMTLKNEEALESARLYKARLRLKNMIAADGQDGLLDEAKKVQKKLRSIDVDALNEQELIQLEDAVQMSASAGASRHLAFTVADMAGRVVSPFIGVSSDALKQRYRANGLLTSDLSSLIAQHITSRGTILRAAGLFIFETVAAVFEAPSQSTDEPTGASET